MANKSHNVRDEELIELLKAKQGLTEVETIKKSEKIELHGAAKVRNYLYYAAPTIAVIAIICIIAFSIGKSIITSKRPDVTVVINTGSCAMDTITDQISREFEKYCIDSNGDKTVLVETAECSFDVNSKNYTETEAKSTKFQIQFSRDNAQLFILTYDYLDEFEKSEDGGFWVDDLGLPDYGGKAIKLNGTVFEEIYRQNYSCGFPEDFYLCMRKVSDKQASSKQGKPALEAGKNILIKLAESIKND